MTTLSGAPEEVLGEPAWQRELDALLTEALLASDFHYVSLSMRRSTVEFEIVAVAVSPAAPIDAAERTAVNDLITGTFWPIAPLVESIERGEQWGSMHLARQSQFPSELARSFYTEYPAVSGPEAWDVENYVFYSFVDSSSDPAEGSAGILAIGYPDGGRRPDPLWRERVESILRRTGTAALAVTRRHELERQIDLARSARVIVRTASSHQTPEEIISVSRDAILEAFDARSVWIRSKELSGAPRGVLYGRTNTVEVSDEIVAFADALAPAYWREQTFLILSERRAPSGPVDPSVAKAALAAVTAQQLGSALFVPLGAGTECLGCLVLTRSDGLQEWTDVETEGAMDLAHDLGRAFLTARLFSQERRLAFYKQQMMATVAHELKSPLTVAAGHAELLESFVVDPEAQTSLAILGLAVTRLTALADELVTLSQVSEDSPALVARPIDLAAVVTAATRLLHVTATANDLHLITDIEESALIVPGDGAELDRLCVNLITNAIKYTPSGGRVQVTLSRVLDSDGASACLQVTDTGIGIAEEDHDFLFDEFFRSASDETRAQPGAGLGLAIVNRIVRRHDGKISVASQRGSGTTFRVILPLSS